MSDRTAISDAVAYTVIICVRNGATTLRTQLDALASQRNAPLFELVLVDNGSTDETAAVFDSWRSHDMGAVSEALLVPAFLRPGLAYARNVGATAARGQYLLFCDADDRVAPGWAAGAMAAFERGAEVVTGRVKALGAGDAPTDRVVLDRPAHIGPRWGLDRMATVVEYFWGCSFGLTADLYERIGGFDQSFPPYGCDDVEFGIRLCKADVPVEYEPSMTIYYRQVSGFRRRLRREFKDGIARRCLVERHPDVFLDHLGLAGTLARLPKRASLPWRVPNLRLGTRVLLTIEGVTNQIGSAYGYNKWVRSGRLGKAVHFSAVEGP